MKRNYTIYTGRVGAPMRAPKHRVGTRRIVRLSVRCTGGPLHGRALRMDAAGGHNTLPFRLGAHVGHYANGTWVPLAERAAA